MIITGALLCVGGFIGTIAFGFITEKLGKKVALMILVIPHMVMNLPLN